MQKLKLGCSQGRVTGATEDRWMMGGGREAPFPLESHLRYGLVWPRLTPSVRSQVSGKIWDQASYRCLWESGFFLLFVVCCFALFFKQIPLGCRDLVFTEIIPRPGRSISSLHVIFLMMSNKNVDLICSLNPQICSKKIVKCTKSNLVLIWLSEG